MGAWISQCCTGRKSVSQADEYGSDVNCRAQAGRTSPRFNAFIDDFANFGVIEKSPTSKRPSVREKPPPDLPDEAAECCERAWIRRGDPDEIFVQAFNITIKRSDLQTLANTNWLNDEIINFYLNLICERSKYDHDPPLPKVYAYNTFFLQAMRSRGYAGVKRWTRNVDIFSYEILLVPVHLGNHWCLATIDLKFREVSYFDSLGETNDECLQMLRYYLIEEHKDKRNSEIDLSQWHFQCPQNIPYQMNGSDCGVFTCCFAEFRSRRSKLMFSYRSMPYYRQRIVYEICTKQLIN